MIGMVQSIFQIFSEVVISVNFSFIILTEAVPPGIHK